MEWNSPFGFGWFHCSTRAIVVPIAFCVKLFWYMYMFPNVACFMLGNCWCNIPCVGTKFDMLRESVWTNVFWSRNTNSLSLNHLFEVPFAWKKNKTVSFFWCVRMECVFAIELAKTTCFHQLSVDDWSKSTVRDALRALKLNMAETIKAWFDNFVFHNNFRFVCSTWCR